MKKGNSLFELGKRIRAAREEANLTQYQLFRKTGISTTQISAYENGKKNIGLSSLYKIAIATGKTIDELYSGSQSIRPITTAGSDSELIVNCIVALYDIGVIGTIIRGKSNENVPQGYEYYYRIGILEYLDILNDMIIKLEDLNREKDTYPDPTAFREQIIGSAIHKIHESVKKKIKKL